MSQRSLSNFGHCVGDSLIGTGTRGGPCCGFCEGRWGGSARFLIKADGRVGVAALEDSSDWDAWIAVEEARSRATSAP